MVALQNKPVLDAGILFLLVFIVSMIIVLCEGTFGRCASFKGFDGVTYHGCAFAIDLEVKVLRGAPAGDLIPMVMIVWLFGPGRCQQGSDASEKCNTKQSHCAERSQMLKRVVAVEGENATCKWRRTHGLKEIPHDVIPTLHIERSVERNIIASFG